MPAVIRVHLRGNEDGALTHQFQNLGEACWHKLGAFAQLDIDEIDSSKDTFVIRGIRKRDLGRVTRILEQLIRRHMFTGQVTLERLDLMSDP